MQSFNVSDISIIKILFMTAVSFIVAMVWTPFLTNFLYKNRFGKKIRDTGFDNNRAPIFYSLHKGKENTPVMGGLLIWVTVAVLAFWFSRYPQTSYLSRSATWLPLAALIGSGVIGAIDDIFNIKGIGPHRGGLKFGIRLLLYLLIACFAAWWFYSKLGWSEIHVPAIGDFNIGLWYVPLFIGVLIFTAFSSNQTDGLDGLAGGIFATSFASYALIALMIGNVSLAIFCGTIMGALLAFLWFNIYPARFFMGDTGVMALGMTLGIVAFLTNTVVVLPLIGFVFYAEGITTIIQIASKKLRHGKKVFLSAPIHHHFEALGWPETKVTMRFWIISWIAAVVGVAVALLGGG
ncbi:MAG: phospho-N-acetylmuramoyl-pentapeptide-transferase [bacterium]|nr:phospho-N-acetylmuramoyl-pentapeptide-transferase [bacterium]